MVFQIALYISLAVFGLGLVYRLSAWVRKDIGLCQADIPALTRVLAAIKGVLTSIFSRRIFALAKAVVVDILFQWRILGDQHDRIVWIMHMLMFIGFMGLLLLHALGGILVSPLFPDYQSTLNPYLFLRNLFGAMVIAGLILAVIRRTALLPLAVKTNAMDKAVILIVGIIIVSGFALEAIKITSHSAYARMVHEYSVTEDKDELHALEAYWVDSFGVVSSRTKGPFAEELLTKGRQVHETSCQACHSEPRSAFVSYAGAKAVGGWSLRLDDAGIQIALYHIHFLCFFLGLAYLPFSKMFHVFATPISILVTAAMDGAEQDSVNDTTRQAIELDGCGHRGTCHLECPVRTKRQERIDMLQQFDPVFDHIGEQSLQDLGTRESA